MNPLRYLTLGEYYAISLGIIFFSLFIGFTGLDPTNTGWLMAGMDSNTNYLGWGFFRRTDFWQFPLGANPDYGMAMSSSIVFTDSIPLFAIFFKLFDHLLPEHFQYNGLFLLFNFILQSLLSYKIIGLFVKNKEFQLLGAMLFLITPILLVSIHIHHALSAHWLILGGLYLYFQDQFCFRKWLFLLVLASLIHAYLLCMVLGLWGAELLQQYLKKRASLRKLVSYLVISIIVLFVCMTLTGYFMLDSKAVQLPTHILRTNLLALIDPGSSLFDPGASLGLSWSVFLPDIPTAPIDHFSYIGLGMLLLFLLAGLLCYKNGNFRAVSWKTQGPLSLTLIIFSIFSLSNQIALGDKVIFSYTPPAVIEQLFFTLRAPSRFIWPVFYILFLFSIVSIYRYKSQRQGIIIIALAIAFQIIDFSQMLTYLWRKPLSENTWTTPLVSPLWKELAGNYNNLKYILPSNYAQNFKDLAYFALENDLTTNVGYFARVNNNAISTQRKILHNNLVYEDTFDHALYIFNDKSLWQYAINKSKDTDFVGIIDNFRVIAPNMANCQHCSTYQLDIDQAKNHYLLDQPVNSQLSFGKNSTDIKHLLLGWSKAEQTGTWSISDEAIVYFKIPHKIKSTLSVEIEARGYISHLSPLQTVDVMANNVLIDQLNFRTWSIVTKKIIIPKKIIDEKNGSLMLSFKIHSPHSPFQAGASSDKRMLGINLKKITFHDSK